VKGFDQVIALRPGHADQQSARGLGVEEDILHHRVDCRGK
jgi:hypothetical protein